MPFHLLLKVASRFCIVGRCSLPNAACAAPPMCSRTQHLVVARVQRVWRCLLAALFPAGGAMACVVIDAAEQLPTPLLASLLTCSSANVAWVLISQLAPGTAAFQSGVREMPDIDSLAFDSYASATLSTVGVGDAHCSRW